MTIPLLDLKAQYNLISEEINAAVKTVLESGEYILGKNVVELEAAVANLCGVSYGVGVASGTDALLLALEACDIKPGDEVITSPYTFFATAEVISRLGARPVFCDIDINTYNLNPNLLEFLITPRTRAIIPVHLYGQVTGMVEILELARRYNLFVIEDACQSMGAVHYEKKAGSWGDVGCFSFFPSKNLGAYGDGGMVVTSNEIIAARIKKLRHHGTDQKYYHSVIGYNSRLDEIQAAILRVKLKYLEQWNNQRRANAALYNQLFDDSSLVLPVEVSGSRHIYHQYVIRHPRRDRIMVRLNQCQIGCAVYYPLPLHLQEVYRGLGLQPGAFSMAELAARETLALPVYPELGQEQIAFIAG
ncbi:MAG: DegT/DnrJ/EryC1/StrS family aminotransferase, partial [Desulfotomaculaceae bacterium]|nr:DegT/DnrJ/EryC1/StrS family aminotransferase [Desulfotomaculaceae bacterium]